MAKKKKQQIMLVEREDARLLDSRHPNTKEEQEEVAYITRHLNRMYENQTQKYKEFRNRTLVEYLNDNEERVNTYVPPRGETIDDWQANASEGVTREKMFAYIANVALDRPRYKFKAVRDDGFIDNVIADTIKTFYRYTWNIEDPIGTDFMLDAWKAAGHGTMIKFEGIEQEQYEDYDFDEYDVTTGEMKGLKTIQRYSELHCKSRRVPVNKILVDNPYQPNVQKQVRLAEIETLTHDEFLGKYGNFYKAKQVPCLSTHAKELFEETFHQEQWNTLTNKDEVHVVHFMTKENGKALYRVIANGVLILASPIPRKDRMYPYARCIHRPFADENFFYGKALPDEIADDQDLYDAVKNSMIDRTILHVNRPMISDKPNDIVDQVWGPNRIMTVKGDNVRPLDITPVAGGDMQVLQEMRSGMDRQTSDSQQSGQVEAGATARGIVIADEKARKLMGVPRKFLEFYHWEATKLRIGNIMQFYFDPVRVDEILSEEGQSKLESIYRDISVDGETLADRREGTKVIQIVGNRADLKDREELDIDEEMARLQGFELQVRQVTADYIKRFQVDTQLIPESSHQQSKSLEQALEMEYQGTIAKIYPQKFQQFNDVFFRELNKAFDRDMTLFDQAQPQSPTPPPEGEADGVTPELAEDLTGGAGPTLGEITGATV